MRIDRLTPAGRREFREWIAEPLAMPRPRDASLARLAFLERQPRETRTERLHEYRTLLVAALKKASPGSTAARRRWRVLLEAERAWVDAERALLEAAAEEAPAPR